MASSAKKKTTMAKLQRENAVRERRARKQARKDLRKQTAAHPEVLAEPETLDGEPETLDGEPETLDGEPAVVAGEPAVEER